MHKLSPLFACIGLAMLGGLGWIAWFALKAYPVLWWPVGLVVLAQLFVDLPAFCDFCDSPIEKSKRVWKIGSKSKTACPECRRHHHVEPAKARPALSGEAGVEEQLGETARLDDRAGLTRTSGLG